MDISRSDRVVLTDASVLINFFHLERLDPLGNLPEHKFLVPDHVVEEISEPGQRILVVAVRFYLGGRIPADG